MEDEVIKRAEEEGQGTVVLMLSLYLILLAFFILLNAISEVNEQKVKVVSESVAEGFDFRKKSKNILTQDTTSVHKPIFNQLAKDVQGILETFLTLKEYQLQVEGDNNTIFVRLSLNKVFYPNSPNIRPVMAPFFDDIAAAITKNRPGMQIWTTVTVKDLVEAQNLELSGRRASLVVRAMLERDLAPERLKAVAKEGEEQELAIVFESVIVDAIAAEKEAERIRQEKRAAKGLPPLPTASGQN